MKHPATPEELFSARRKSGKVGGIRMMSWATFFSLVGMTVTVPYTAYLAARHLPHWAGIFTGAVLGIGCLCFALWRAYRDSLP